MTDLRKAAEMALEALDDIHSGNLTPMAEESWNKAKEALRQALAEPANSTTGFVESKALSQTEQEPVAWFIQYEDSHEFVWSKPDGWRVKQALEIQPLYTAPPKKEWVGLTDEEINDWFFQRLKQAGAGWAFDDVVRAVEAKLKKKNK